MGEVQSVVLLETSRQVCVCEFSIRKASFGIIFEVFTASFVLFVAEK